MTISKKVNSSCPSPQQQIQRFVPRTHSAITMPVTLLILSWKKLTPCQAIGNLVGLCILRVNGKSIPTRNARKWSVKT